MMNWLRRPAKDAAVTQDPAPAQDTHTSSSGHDYGTPRIYEVSWTNGHVEHVRGHQILMPHGADLALLGVPSARRQRWTIHQMIDSQWTIMLSAPDEDIRMVRDVTDGERFGGVGA